MSTAADTTATRLRDLEARVAELESMLRQLISEHEMEHHRKR